MIALVRSLLYAILFYLATVIWVVAGILATLLGQRPMFAVVLSWTELHHWLVENVLRINIRVEGRIPDGAHLIAVKHQSMLETLELVRLTSLPVIVIKKELADIPFFGWLTRRYGVIPVQRSAGSKALRLLVQEGKRAIATGRPVIIYPEGTRVVVGEAPALRSGFAALYRALGLPVVPVAVDSGKLWGRGFVHRAGIVTLRIGETIPPGLQREDIEARVHAQINVLKLLPEVRP